MKQLFRFVMLLFATIISANAFAGDWNIPEPKPSAFVPGDTFAIRNVGTQCFIWRGEAWGTQCCVNKIGQEAFAKREYYLIAPTIEDNETFGSYYIFYDNHGAWGSHRIWRQPGDGNLGPHKGCFVDNAGNGPSSYLWDIQPVGNNKYTIGVPPTVNEENGAAETVAYVEGEFCGVQLDHGSDWVTNNQEASGGVTYGFYYDVVYADNPENCQWEFFNKKDLDYYNAKVDLAQLCDKIKEEGLAINTAAAEALIANENATLQEVLNMIEALKEEIANLADYLHPADVSSKYLVNPKCGTDHLLDGWTYSQTPTWDSDIWEFWNVSGAPTFEQTTKELPAGIYSLSVDGYTRTDMVATFEFGDQIMNLATVSSSEVNNRGAGRTWMDAGNGKNTLFLFLEEPKSVLVRITADNTTGDHWTCWRDFTMTFYGSAQTDYRILAKLYTDGWQDKIEGKYFYAPYADALQAALEKSETGTTKEEILAVYEEVKAAYDDLMKSVALYDELWGYVDPESPTYMDARGDEKYHYDDVFIEVFERVEDMWYDEVTDLNNEEMEALIAEFLQKAQEAIDNTPPERDQDVSYKIVNNKFLDAQDNSSFDGWTVASRRSETDRSNPFQNNSGKRFVVEQWNGGGDGAIIDVYQKVKLWAGAYRLTCKGWYRSTTDQAQHDSNPKLNTVNTFLYGSSSQYRFHDIFEHGYETEWWNEGPANFNIDNQTPNYYSGNVDGLLYPHNCAAANYLFANTNNYDMVAEFISTGDSIKLGVKGQDIPAGGWLIWNDFVLTFIGNELEDMQPIAMEAAEMYRDYLNEHMAAATKAELKAFIDNIDNAPDVATLLEAYKSIGDVVDKAINSMNLYKTLDAAIARLDEKIAEKAETATKEAVAAAEALSDELAKAYDEGAINDEDVPATLERIEQAIKDLNMPDVTGASDDNPIDMTDVITNPRYDNGSAATLNGWTNVDGKATAEYENNHYGVAEGFNTAFDLYQDLIKMPEGTYHVMLQGLYRQEGTVTDAKIWQYGYAEKKGVLDILNEEAKKDVPEYDARAKMYANGDSVAFKPWILIGTDDWTLEAQEHFANGYDGAWTEFHDSISNVGVDEIYYLPNNRLAFYDRAEGKFYDNELYCYVGSDGKLRLGACNLTGKANDWVPFTNWRLEYLGTESKHESTTGIRETEQAGKIEAIYSIDGRRINALQKGMNIVVVNGKAKKIMVK